MALPDIKNPERSVGTTTLGNLRFHGLRWGELVNLSARMEDVTETPAIFLTEAIKLTGRTEDGQPLSSEDVARLMPGERDQIAEVLVEENSGLFREIETRLIESDEGTLVESEDAGLAIPRGEAEGADAYLLKGFRHFHARTRSHLERMKSQLRAFSPGLREALRPAWMDNARAAGRMSEQLRGAFRGLAPGGSSRKGLPVATISHPKMDFPGLELPPSPVVETNRILAAVAEEIATLREVNTSSAEMQESLNEVAKTILTQFSAGAEASAQSAADGLALSRNSLTMARTGVWIAGGSAVLALLAILVSIVLAIRSDERAADQERQDAAIRAEASASQRQLIEALNRHSKSIEERKVAATPPTPPKAPAAKTK